eukprot:CAMPEP_0195112442 /NCGR_PEP_ID=MMETSP0448-20130528/99131_1 /TAXON_ID=66468 /ORGANISM="Heterocapsa triquestra, Strain CCMP 448" /LENGTH=91 /DNA_ID=CAMNT_0040149293 /DNA_START=9 /DNA_END=281 /DNA_ORIENTATION=+
MRRDAAGPHTAGHSRTTRRDQDLAGQLRSKEAQVEHLTNTLRELQVVTQRQIGLYKRQLHLKDSSLQSMQEELMKQEGNVAAATAAASQPA